MMSQRSHSEDEKTIDIGDDIVSVLDENINPDGKASAVDKEDQDSGNYIRDLQSIRKDPDAEGDTFNHFKRGEIDHLRCSPDGRWVVICHRHACIVYDLGNVANHVVLLADDDKRSAEHAEWALKGSLLLTRAEKELRLWKISESTTGQIPKSLHYEKRYVLQEGLCKYVKWLSEKEFLVLSDRGTLYRVDFEKGTKEATLLTQPEAEGFQVTQVYPIVAEKTEWIICLGTMLAKLPKSILSDFEVEGDGVDYILVLRKCDPPATQQSNKYFQGHFHVIGGQDHNAQRVAYEIRHRKILPRNIRNVKFCKYHRYMLVNYDKNEVGTTAPELWALNFDNPESWKPQNITSKVFPTPARTDEIETENNGDQWGEASFAGPAHDVIVCEINGLITFFTFRRNDSEWPSSLKVLEVDMSNLKSDFGQFFHPIFTWGDTVPQPLMVATDHDGKSDVIVWKVPPSNEPATSKMEVEASEPMGTAGSESLTERSKLFRS